MNDEFMNESIYKIFNIKDKIKNYDDYKNKLAYRKSYYGYASSTIYQLTKNKEEYDTVLNFASNKKMDTLVIMKLYLNVVMK